MSRICVVLGCDRAAKPHYNRCDAHIAALVDRAFLRDPEPPIVIRRAERFRLVSER